MINAIVGRPGGGKTYESVRYHILPSILDDKRKVVTNIPVNKEHIKRIHGAEYADLVEVIEGNFSNFGQQRPFSLVTDFTNHNEWKNEKGQGVLFVIDEAHLSLGRDAKKETLEYLSMHRHYGHDLLLLTQNERKLNRDVKDMVEVAYRCTKMAAYGDKDKYIRKTFFGLGDTRNATHTENRQYDKEYFPYYQSHTASNNAVQEATAKGTLAKLNPYKKVTYGFFAVGILIMISPWLTGSDEDAHEQTKQSNTSKPANSAEIVNAAQQPIQSQPTTQPVKLGRSDEDVKKTPNETARERIARQSKEYHPFKNIQLHIDGSYEDRMSGEFATFFSASRNGQRLFRVSLKDLYLAGYNVNIMGDCVVELTYFDYRDFITCDSPTVGVDTPVIAAK